MKTQIKSLFVTAALGLAFMMAPEAKATWMRLCGYVYLDCNNNGIFEPQLGELPIADVDVTLSGAEADGAAPPYAGTKKTGPDGRYCFDVRPGTYTLTETQPSGVPDGKDTVGSCGAGATGNDVFENITLTLADYNAGLRICDNYNFGELCEQPQPGSIGDTVYCDTNGNGVQDAGEPGIAGVTVVLGGPVAASTTTDANGQYLFSNLPAGAYVVMVDANSVPQSCSVPSCPTEMPVTLSAGQNFLDADFCFKPPTTTSPGTGTPGYWKNHPKAWPVDQITIGGIVYTKAQAIRRMKLSVTGHKERTMFNALVCAKLNVIIGNEASCIADTIALADQWMATYGSAQVLASSNAWKIGEPLYLRLDDYNNGRLCAPHRN